MTGNVCAGIVPICDGHAFLGMDKNGFWSSFSGKVEKDETVVQAAVREFNEESSGIWNLTVSDFHRLFLNEICSTTPSGKRIHIFVLKFTDTIALFDFVPNSEKLQVGWISLKGKQHLMHHKFKQDYRCLSLLSSQPSPCP